MPGVAGKMSESCIESTDVARSRSPLAVGKKQTLGFYLGDCCKMQRSSNMLSGSIEKPPPPSAIICFGN
ncbi:MAG: hypothetical protein WBA13_12050 [Microcoleaceae cyanobacterium]